MEKVEICCVSWHKDVQESKRARTLKKCMAVKDGIPAHFWGGVRLRAVVGETGLSEIRTIDACQNH